MRRRSQLISTSWQIIPPSFVSDWQIVRTLLWSAFLMKIESWKNLRNPNSFERENYCVLQNWTLPWSAVHMKVENIGRTLKDPNSFGRKDYRGPSVLHTIWTKNYCQTDSALQLCVWWADMSWTHYLWKVILFPVTHVLSGYYYEAISVRYMIFLSPTPFWYFSNNNEKCQNQSKDLGKHYLALSLRGMHIGELNWFQFQNRKHTKYNIFLNKTKELLKHQQQM